MRTACLLAIVAALAALSLPSCAAATKGLIIPQDWKPCVQPDLASQFASAPALDMEDLGIAMTGLDAPEVAFCPSADGKSWHALVWYRRDYRHKTRVYIADLNAGTVKLQKFEKEEGQIRMEVGFTWWGVIGADGKLYGPNPDWYQWNTGGAMNIYQYDPAEKEVKLFKVIPGHGGERNPMVASPNGWIYGASTWLKQDADRVVKAAAYGFNPVTGEVRDFGAIGPRMEETGYGYTMGCDETHIYVACGQVPWALVAIDIKSGEQKTLLTAPEGGYINRMEVRPRFGGAEVFVQQADDAPKQYYWLYHGQATPRPGATDFSKTGDTRPWPAIAPLYKAPPRPEVFSGQLEPDETGHATLWWRSQPLGPELVAKGQGEGKWNSIPIDGIDQYPLKITRLVALPSATSPRALPDGRLFGIGGGYRGRFFFDPKTGVFTQAGAHGGQSIYPLIVYEGLVYWSGYPSAPIYAFDPNKPWTIRPAGPPDSGVVIPDEASAESNPRRVHADYFLPVLKTRVKKMLSATLAADGRIYFGGRGLRDYDGGGLSWYDPKTGEVDGMWQPFAYRSIGWVTTAVNGRYVVIGAEGGRGFFYDTVKRALAGTFKPAPKVSVTGPVIEVAPGRMLGVTRDPEVKGGGILYGLEVPSGKILFVKKIPFAVPFDWGDGIGAWDYVKGPDGFIWASMGEEYLVRIDPRDARVIVVGKTKPVGHMAFIGRDLYMGDTEHLRRLKNIF